MDRASLSFSEQVRDAVLLRRDLDDEFWDDLLQVLVGADCGMPVAEALVARLRARVRDERMSTPEQAVRALKAEMLAVLEARDRQLHIDQVPAVVLMVGVNGSGKTTTIGKLAHRLQAEGRTTLIAAADTFRAAAIDQMRLWADRSGSDVIAHQPGGDPGAVVYDALQAAVARRTDCVLVDTAGPAPHQGQPDGRADQGAQRRPPGHPRGSSRDAPGHRGPHRDERDRPGPGLPRVRSG